MIKKSLSFRYRNNINDRNNKYATQDNGVTDS